MFRQWLVGCTLGVLTIGWLLSSAVTPLQAGGPIAQVDPLAQGKEPQLHEGILISTGTSQVSLRAADGKEHAFQTNDRTRIKINGKPGKLADLKPGIEIRVMVGQTGQVISVSTVDDRKSGP